jgi:hypothetical protein
LVHTSPTIQTHRTAEIVVDRKHAVSAVIFAGIVPLFWSLRLQSFRPIFNRRSLQQKIPFPAAGFDGQYRSVPRNIGHLWGQKCRRKLVRIIAD